MVSVLHRIHRWLLLANIRRTNVFDFHNADWDFPVERQDIFDGRGEVIDGHKAVVRTDTNDVLGVHGSRYTIVSNSDVVNSIDDAIRKANISKDVSVKISSIEGGRKMRGEILFNDLTDEPSVGDYVKFRISFFNSYDGSWAFTQAADGLRLFCLNGCTHSCYYRRHYTTFVPSSLRVHWSE